MDNGTPIIAITGGPCSGKDRFMERVKDVFQKLGYAVETIENETATELMSCGVSPSSVGNVEFQRQVLVKSILKEDDALARMSHVAGKKVIFVNRGVMDGLAYIDPNSMRSIWSELGHHIVHLRDKRYAGVIHLVTVGIGLPHLFSNENNPTRWEKSAEEAAATDERTLAAWIGCPHLAYVDNSTSFEMKMERAFTWAQYFLEEVENERKWKLLVPFSRDLIPAHAQRIDIRQSYVRAPDSAKNERIRLRGQDGVHIPFRTLKGETVGMSCPEKDIVISESEHAHLHGTCGIPGHQEVVKHRWCFVENSLYWELDVFRDWEHDVLLEVELPHAEWKVLLPSILGSNVIEVTGNPNYSNRAIAQKIAASGSIK